MKRILVTGAAGFVGSSLVDRLLVRGDHVIAVDNFNRQYDPAIKRRNIRDSIDHPAYRLHEADVRDSAALRKIFADEMPDMVVHVAGRTGMSASQAEAEDFLDNNHVGTARVTEACGAARVRRLIYISTASVYGSTALPAVEDMALPAPANPYVASKILGEEAIKHYSEAHGGVALILRLFTVYGPRQRSEMAISRFAEQISGGEPVALYGDGSAVREYLYIENCVDGILRALDRPALPSRLEIVNIGEERSISLMGLVSLLSVLIGRPARIEFKPNPAGIPLALRGNIEKARRLLGYGPAVSLEEGLRRFLEWRQTRAR